MFIVLLTQQSKNACHHLKSDKHQDPTYSPQGPSEKSIGRMLGIKNLLQFRKQTNKKNFKVEDGNTKIWPTSHWFNNIKLLMDDLKMPSPFLKHVLVWQLSPKEESTFRCRYVLLFENIFIYLCTHFSRVEKLQCIPRFGVIMGQCSSLLSGNNTDLFIEKQKQSFFFLVL